MIKSSALLGNTLLHKHYKIILMKTMAIIIGGLSKLRIINFIFTIGLEETFGLPLKYCLSSWIMWGVLVVPILMNRVLSGKANLLLTNLLKWFPSLPY